MLPLFLCCRKTLVFNSSSNWNVNFIVVVCKLRLNKLVYIIKSGNCQLMHRSPDDYFRCKCLCWLTLIWNSICEYQHRLNKYSCQTSAIDEWGNSIGNSKLRFFLFYHYWSMLLRIVFNRSLMLYYSNSGSHHFVVAHV